LNVLSSATSGSPSWSKSDTALVSDRFTAASGVCAEDRAGRLVERASAKYERTRSAGNRSRRANRRVGFCGSRNMRALFAARFFWTRRLVTPDSPVSPAFRSVSYGGGECGEPQSSALYLVLCTLCYATTTNTTQSTKYKVLSSGNSFVIKKYQRWAKNVRKRMLQIPALAGRLIWSLTR
jgi:hypothetical protein